MDSPAGPLPPEEAEPLPIPSTIRDRRALITSGLVWTGALQVFLVGMNFVSMLVLVRLISPAEYGRATAAIGVLALINCFNCSYFIAQALQLHEGQEPDWGAHWSAGFYIQIGLFILCNAVASICWLLPPYRPMTGPLLTASIGLLFDWPNQLGLTQLRREMDYRTLRLVQASSALLTVVTSLSLALAGAGALALIVGSNVLHGMPQGFYLLVIRKWRPPPRWWHWPNWKKYQGSLKFGAQLSGSAVLTAARGMLEASVLPATLGYESLGLLNRAQVLFSTTVGRVATVVIDTIYPLLPRSAGNEQQFARHASLFVQVMLWVSIPGAVFVGWEGPQLSRLLYGSKWIAADPLILPGTVFAWAVSTVLIFATVLQAQNRLRSAFLSSAAAAILCVPAILAVLAGVKVQTYAWIAAAGQLVALLVVTKLASRSLGANWFRAAVLPPVAAAAAALVALIAVETQTHRWLLILRICLSSGLFAAAVMAVMRLFFPQELREIIIRLPGSSIMSKLLRV